MNAAEWSLLLTLSLLWGGSFLFNGLAVRELPTFTIVFLRVGLAALLLNLFLLSQGRNLSLRRKDWTGFVGMGLMNNVLPFCLIVWGQTRIPSGLAAILNATAPLFTILLAHCITRDEKASGNRLAGVGIGIGGVILVVGPAVLHGMNGQFPAQLAVLAAAFSYACAGLFGRRFSRRGVLPLVSATGQVTAASMIMLPLWLGIDHPWQLTPPGAASWLALLGLALGSTILAYLIYFRLLASAGASNLLLVTLLIPVSALCLGGIVLGEQPEIRHLEGIGLIGLGLAVTDGRLLGLFRRRQGMPAPSLRGVNDE
jgi:drug/metabolite transporter (DMT)-like permease